MDVQATKKQLLSSVDRLLPAWRELALRIHAHPELGYEEHQAAAWLGDALERAGFSVTRGVAATPTAFHAVFDTAPDAPCVAFLAEYDARPGSGHSCGHNLSGPASCIAGIALAEALKLQPVRIRVLGTPAEETGLGGKLRMLDHGIFRDVTFSMMAHAGYMNLPSRDMRGHRRIAVDFRVKEDAVDASANPLDALLLCMHGVDVLRRKLRPRTRIDAVVTKGGSLDQVTGAVFCKTVYEPARAEMLIVSTEATYIKRLERRLEGIARAAADATGTEAVWSGEWSSYLPMRRNPAMEAAYESNLAFMSEPLGQFPSDWSIGCTDCGNVSQILPTIHAYFKAAAPGIEHHTPAYAEASRSELGLAGMATAAKAMALTGMDLLVDENLRMRVWEDFRTIENEFMSDERGASH